MNRRRFLGLAGRWAGALTLSPLAIAHRGSRQPPGGGGTALARRVEKFLGRFDQEPPFSFTYGGRPSSTLLARWPRTRQSVPLDPARTAHTLTWSDPQTGLVVRCVVVDYHDYPTIEWTLYFKNPGAQNTPLLRDVLALDTTVQRARGGEFVLHTCSGSMAVAEDYGLHTIPLPPASSKLFTCLGGRPTNDLVRDDPHLPRGGFPYYNIDWGGQGLIVAIGWPGQWAAEMTRDAGVSLHLQAGMSSRDGLMIKSGDHIWDTELVALALAPGEEIRTPLIAVQMWQGRDWIDAQNVWRRWMIDHNMPRPYGRPPPPMCPTGGVSGFFTGMLGAGATDELSYIGAYADERTTATTGGVYDHWWIDAGWYSVPPNATDWSWTGTWEPDPKRYPHGLRPVTDHARARGMKSIVWHEPERVRPGTWLYRNHPEWLLGPGPDGDARLLNLGNPRAWRWVVEHFNGLIRDGGVDVYRQDFNIDPLAYWNMADPAGRRGITQIRHVTGFLAFWDELRRRHPNLLIDACASGGRRNDLETMRRGVPLWRSDDNAVPADEQSHTYGVSLWLPYHGTGVGPDNVYLLRSAMVPSFLVPFQAISATNETLGLVRRMTREWREIAANLLGDYYPLTPYSLDTDVWMVWQFNRPDVGEGMVQAFRRDDSAVGSMRLKLRGLDAAATYELKNFDVGGTTHATGRELMTVGLVVRLSARPAAATIAYKRITSW